jgi:hypothetical protein
LNAHRSAILIGGISRGDIIEHYLGAHAKLNTKVKPLPLLGLKPIRSFLSMKYFLNPIPIFMRVFLK